MSLNIWVVCAIYYYLVGDWAVFLMQRKVKAGHTGWRQYFWQRLTWPLVLAKFCALLYALRALDKLDPPTDPKEPT